MAFKSTLHDNEHALVTDLIRNFSSEGRACGYIYVLQLKDTLQ
jgi:hypothetical protein